MDLLFLLLLLNFCQVFGQSCTKCVNYHMVKNFKPEKANLLESFLSLTSPKLAICSNQCSKERECLAAIFDEEKSTCFLFNHTIMSEYQEKSPITLMTKEEKGLCDGSKTEKHTLVSNKNLGTKISINQSMEANKNSSTKLSLISGEDYVKNFSIDTYKSPSSRPNPNPISTITASTKANLNTSINSTTSIKIFRDCQDAFDDNHTTNGVFTLQLDSGSQTPSTLQAMCHFDVVGWTVFQTRLDGSVQFNRSWADYVQGFGSPDHEYWLGLDNLHLITRRNRKLAVLLEAHDGELRTAEYGSFEVENSSLFYTLRVVGYNGTAGDSLTNQNGVNFSTFDMDNDKNQTRNCAMDRKGGWWYSNCGYSNLNGVWYAGVNNSRNQDGAYWKDFKGWLYSYKKIIMRVGR